MLTFHITSLLPPLQRVQGLFIATHIREVAVELSRNKEEKSLSHKADKEKGILDLLGSNLTYLLHLGQVATHR